MENIIVRKTKLKDMQKVKEILSDASLPYEDIDEHGENFLVAEFDGKIAGSIGLELYDKSGLLRSLAVVDSFRGSGIGKELVTALISYAKEKGVRDLYLLTTTAEEYFKKAGFRGIDRSDVDAAIAGTKEFSSLCPSSSACMKKVL